MQCSLLRITILSLVHPHYEAALYYKFSMLYNVQNNIISWDQSIYWNTTSVNFGIGLQFKDIS